MRNIITILSILLLSTCLQAAEFIPKKLSQMTDDLGVGTHTADTSNPHGTTTTQTNLTVTNLTVTNTMNTGTATVSGFVSQTSGTASGTVLTNVSIVSGTASLTSPILTGNVGFGTTTPSEAIHIYEGDIEVERTAQSPVINLYQNAQITGDIAQFNYRANNSANAVTTYVGIIGQAMDNTSGSETGSLAFNIYNNGSYAERMRVRGANVGIGTTTPQTRLAINGDISIQANGYTNFGVGTSSNGYGVRDNSGTMQFKNSGGAWGNIASFTSGGGWQDDGTNIRPITVTDTVTIGSTTASGTNILTVTGGVEFNKTTEPTLDLYRIATGTAGLGVGISRYYGQSNNQTQRLYGSIEVEATSPTNGSEIGSIIFNTIDTTNGERMRIRGENVLIGTTTSSTKLNVGGTVTASGFSGNGAGLTGVTFAGYSGMPVKITGTATNALGTGTTISDDNTIPQSNEGTEILTLSHTPLNASNWLLVEAVANISVNSVASVPIAAIFKNSDTDAIGANRCMLGSNASNNKDTIVSVSALPFVAGTTTPFTFKLRCGNSDGATTRINASAQDGLGRFGGVWYTSLKVTEYQP